MELLGDATQISVRSGEAVLSGKAAKDFRIDIGAQVGFKIDPKKLAIFLMLSQERLASYQLTRNWLLRLARMYPATRSNLTKFERRNSASSDNG